MACYVTLIRAGTAAVSVLLIATAHAQEMEPRAYSPSPVGTNCVIMDFAHLRGQVLTDPSVPVTDIHAKIDAYILGYAHSFGLAGRLAIVAPTGQYVPTRLINVGANRWALKPEIGVSQPIGDWFAEGPAGVWLYADNNDFFGGQHKSQDRYGYISCTAVITSVPGCGSRRTRPITPVAGRP